MAHVARRNRIVMAACIAALAMLMLSLSVTPAGATTQNGVIYGPSPNDPPPNAAEIAVKTQQLAQVSPAVQQLLTLNQGNPVPQPGNVPQSSACEDGCGRCSVSCNPPAAMKNSVSGQRQQQSSWCVPAAVATLFTTYSMAGITQSTLASEMNTTSTGTRLSEAPDSLNSRQNYNYYWYQEGFTSGSDILQTVTLDVWNYGSDVVLPGQGWWLPWWQQNGFQGRHAFVLYGYYTQSGGGFYIWDPLYQPWAGFHTLNKDDAYFINEDAADDSNSTPALLW